MEGVCKKIIVKMENRLKMVVGKNFNFVEEERLQNQQ